MIRLEGKNIVSSACNSGTSALVSKDGELFIFGKDNAHCDHNTGETRVERGNPRFWPEGRPLL